MESMPRLEIERVAYQEFLTLWERGTFDNQRLGQAFYNHFRLSLGSIVASHKRLH